MNFFIWRNDYYLRGEMVENVDRVLSKIIYFLRIEKEFCGSYLKLLILEVRIEWSFLGLVG